MLSRTIVFLFCLFYAFQAIGAVRIVDPSNSTMYVDEGFECPYVLELSNQEGKTLSSTEMAAITKIRVYFGDSEYTDSDLCPDCFNYELYASKGRIVCDLGVGEYNWTDGTDTATLLVYDTTYTEGRRIGTFSMTADGSLGAATVTPSTAIAVITTTDQTIAGIKTFTSSPIIPTPTTDYQSATKKIC